MATEKRHTFVDLGVRQHTQSWLRIPNISAMEIWSNIRAFTKSERNSLITFLVKANHPAAKKLRQLQKQYS